MRYVQPHYWGGEQRRELVLDSQGHGPGEVGAILGGKVTSPLLGLLNTLERGLPLPFLPMGWRVGGLGLEPGNVRKRFFMYLPIFKMKLFGDLAAALMKFGLITFIIVKLHHHPS